VGKGEQISAGEHVTVRLCPPSPVARRCIECMATAISLPAPLPTLRTGASASRN